jgi:hypothetical protein
MDRPYLDIETAVANSLAGDVIFVWPGTYTVNNLSLTGTDLYFTDGAIVTSTSDMFLIDSIQDVNITGFGKFTVVDGALLNVTAESNILFESISVDITNGNFVNSSSTTFIILNTTYFTSSSTSTAFDLSGGLRMDIIFNFEVAEVNNVFVSSDQSGEIIFNGKTLTIDSTAPAVIDIISGSVNLDISRIEFSGTGSTFANITTGSIVHKSDTLSISGSGMTYIDSEAEVDLDVGNVLHSGTGTLLIFESGTAKCNFGTLDLGASSFITSVDTIFSLKFVDLILTTGTGASLDVSDRCYITFDHISRTSIVGSIFALSGTGDIYIDGSSVECTGKLVNLSGDVSSYMNIDTISGISGVSSGMENMGTGTFSLKSVNVDINPTNFGLELVGGDSIIDIDVLTLDTTVTGIIVSGGANAKLRIGYFTSNAANLVLQGSGKVNYDTEYTYSSTTINVGILMSASSDVTIGGHFETLGDINVLYTDVPDVGISRVAPSIFVSSTTSIQAVITGKTVIMQASIAKFPPLNITQVPVNLIVNAAIV